MFCTLEDAWGEKDFSDKINKIEVLESKKNIDYKNHVPVKIHENFSEPEDLYKQYLFLKQKFDNDNVETQVCIATENHISKCKFCQKKYYSNSFPPINLHNILNYFRNNKDLISIVLIGLLIILILNLFLKM